VKNNALYVGIDFSRNYAQVAVKDAQGHALGHSQRLPNTYPGYQQFKALLLEMLQEESAERLVIGGEATSYYWLPYYHQLACDPAWQSIPMDNYLLNARWVRWFKKRHSPTHKDDDIDAGEISEYVRIDPPDTTWQYDENWLSLRFLTRLRFHLAHSLTREKNLALLYVFLLYPSYKAKHPFSDVFGVTSQRFLSNHELMDELEDLSVEDLTAELEILSGGSLPTPAQTAQDFLQVFDNKFPLPDALRVPLQDGLRFLIETIRHLHKQVHLVNDRIAQQVHNGDYPEVGYLQSVPYIGPVLASGIAVEIGSLTRFSEQPVWDKHKRCYRKRSNSEINDAVHKFAGLWWRHHQSGDFSAADQHLSREGNPYLRYYVSQAAESMRLHIPSFTRYYLQKKAQATRHAHKRALVLTASKVLDLCVTLLRHKEYYQAKENCGTSVG